MTRDEVRQSALALPAAERRDLVEELWESLESDPEPLRGWQRQLLDDRLESLEVKPDDGEPFEVVEGRVWPSKE